MIHRTAPPLVLGAVLALACGHADVTRSLDRHPVYDTGVAATIIMPGQQTPGMSGYPGYGAYPPGAAPGYGAAPPGQAPPYAAPAPGQAAPGQAPPQAAPAPGQPAPPYGYAPPPAPSGPRYSSIGGTRIDELGQRRQKSQPGIGRYFAAPFAALAYPFKKLGEMTGTGAPDPAQEQAAAGLAGGAPPPGPPTREQVQAAQEAQRLAELERQLGQGAAPPPAPAPPSGAAPSPGGAPLASAPGSSLSIADELAALRESRRRAGESAMRTAALSEPLRIPRATPRPRGVADHVEDRNGDGRPDFWVFRRDDRVVREEQDTDADGRPDRTVYYDDQGEVSRVEEDTNRDGEPDDWAEYQAGVMQRRRSDSDGDGSIDAWSFYRQGEIARTERDTDGDGFRDRVDLYTAGRLVREDEDRDADGRPDRITWYDAQGEITRRDEDSDGDGAVDVRSHYEAGRLKSRELLTPEALAEISRAELPTAEGANPAPTVEGAGAAPGMGSPGDSPAREDRRAAPPVEDEHAGTPPSFRE